MIWHGLIVLACAAALAYGANLLVDAASRMARQLGISDLLIGLTIVSVCTAAPEIAITISTAVQGKTAVSVSNVVGSNIFNLGFILGMVTLIRPLATNAKVTYRDGGLLMLASGLLLFFMRDLQLNQTEGGLLLLLLLAYTLYLFYKRDGDEEEARPHGRFQPRDIALFLLGLSLILAGGHFLVESASSIARHFGLSEWLIGLTIIAGGTSAPELATSLVAALRGHSGLSIGNLVGSNIFNLLGVLGLAGLIQSTPLAIAPAALTSIGLLTAFMLLVLLLMRSQWRVVRWEGALLLATSFLLWYLDWQLH